MSKKSNKKRQEALRLFGAYLPDNGKSKEKDRFYSGVTDLEQQFMDDVADTLEQYLYIADRALIIEDISYQEKEAAIKTVTKAIKKLRKGDPSGAWDSADRYREEFEAWKVSQNNHTKYGYY